MIIPQPIPKKPETNPQHKPVEIINIGSKNIPVIGKNMFSI